MYPRLCAGVELGSYVTGEDSAEQYYAVNPEGKEYTVSRDIFDVLQGADGTAPLGLKGSHARALEEKLKKANLITTRRLVIDGMWNRFILFTPGRCSRRRRAAAALLNTVLPWLSPAVLLLGIAVTVKYPICAGTQFHAMVYYCALFLSLSLHELGHYHAAIAYGHKVTDVGITLLGILPLGAYVAFHDKKESRRRRLQLVLAGIEMNLFCAGVFLLIRYGFPELSFTFLLLAAMNVVLALVNLLPCSGLDGELALSALLNVESVSGCAKQILTSREKRRRLLSLGISGYVYLGILASTVLAKGIVFGLIALDFVTVIKAVF